MTDHHTSIPLAKLDAWTGNVRKTKGADTALAELAASIAAHGLLQSLVVRKDKRGRYSVVAGKRRLQALHQLASEGRLEPDFAVPCRVLADADAAAEVSLAENAVREAMHPADECEAFRALIDQGASVADIAARFGYSESAVQKRLRLARVSPVILAAYRAGDLALDHVMAFAVTDDAAVQERLYSDAPPWTLEDAGAIRDALTEADIAATDPRVQFVGVKSYEKAGGPTRRDLFTEGNAGVFILDLALLEQLALKKLEKHAKAVLTEGWKWVEIMPRFGYDERASFERRYGEPVPLTDDEAAELATLETEADASYDIEGDLSSEQQARLDAVTARMEELTDNREETWPDDVLTIAGAIVSIGRHGEAEITRGLIRPEDAPQKTRNGKANGDDKATPSLPPGLVESLTIDRSAALAATLMADRRIALAATAHVFAGEVFYGRGFESCLDISIHSQSLRRFEGSKAHAAIEGARAGWQERLPEDVAQFWTWTLGQPEETLIELLTFCAALTVNAVISKGKPDEGRTAHADALAAALTFAPRAWFQPTAANYFGFLSKPQLLADLKEAKGVDTAPAWSSMKKAELAALAEREIAKTDWLPAPLRQAA